MNNLPLPPLPARAADIADFRLDEWTIHPSLNRISRPSGSENLEPRMMHVLVCLAEARGQVLGRRRLLEQVWPDAVVGEEALTRAVSRLRILLGDASQQSRYIETIRGVGYRLLVEPVPIGAEHGAVHGADAVAEDGSGPAAPAGGVDDAGNGAATPGSGGRGGAGAGRRLSLPLAAGLVAMALVVALLAVFWRPSSSDRLPVAPVPFTTYPGFEAHPDLSPDGATVVFARFGDSGQEPGLFLKQLLLDRTRRLTTAEVNDYCPRFSPDGSRVAFVRRTPTERLLMTVPVLGGEPRRLAELVGLVAGLAWTRDSRTVLYAGTDPREDRARIMGVDVHTLAVEPVTDPDLATHVGDSWPDISPDGRRLAFARCDHAGVRDIWIVPVGGGPETQLTQGLDQLLGLRWLPDGRHLVTAAGGGGPMRLWLVDATDGSRRPLPLAQLDAVSHPAVSPRGDWLLYRSERVDYDIMRCRLPQGVGADSLATLAPFSCTTRSEVHPTWSPDGRTVAAVSDRSGETEIWLMDPAGENLRRLTDSPGLDLESPRWSPDGRRLAVTARDNEKSFAVVVDVATGMLRRASDVSHHEQVCGWVPGSEGLKVLWNRDGTWVLATLPDDGAPPLVHDLQLAGHPRVLAASGGLWYVHPESGGLWRASADGGERRVVFPPELLAGVRAWQVLPRGVAVLRAGEQGHEVLLLDPAAPDGGDGQVLARGLPPCLELAVSPDGQAILLTEMQEAHADLMRADLRELLAR